MLRSKMTPIRELHSLSLAGPLVRGVRCIYAFTNYCVRLAFFLQMRNDATICVDMFRLLSSLIPKAARFTSWQWPHPESARFDGMDLAQRLKRVHQ